MRRKKRKRRRGAGKRKKRRRTKTMMREEWEVCLMIRLRVVKRIRRCRAMRCTMKTRRGDTPKF